MSRPLPEPPAFRRAGPADVATIAGLADRIWRAAYAEMLPPGQIDYMLRWMYAPHKLAAEMAAGVHYELALIADDAAGYLAVEALPAEGVAWLHKLYLAPEFHGIGFGQAMLRRAEAVARSTGAGALALRVNKGNAKALRAYRRFGFADAGEACESIGGGFVMDDRLLRLPLL